MAHEVLAADLASFFDDGAGFAVEITHLLSPSDPNPVVRNAIIERPFNPLDDGLAQVLGQPYQVILPASSGLAVGHRVELDGAMMVVTRIEDDESGAVRTAQLRPDA